MFNNDSGIKWFKSNLQKESCQIMLCIYRYNVLSNEITHLVLYFFTSEVQKKFGSTLRFFSRKKTYHVIFK